MHSCCLLIIKEFPTDNVIGSILRPYCENDYYTAYEEGKNPIHHTFIWDYYDLGGRYSGQIKLIVDKTNKEYDWYNMLASPRNNKLFRSKALSTIKWLESQVHGNYYSHEDDYYSAMGFRDGFLYVDAAKIKDIQNLNEIGCFHFVDKDGKAYTRASIMMVVNLSLILILIDS